VVTKQAMGNEVYYAVFFGILFSAIIAAVEYFRIFIYKRKFEYLDYFLVSMAFFNGLGFALVFWGTHKGMNNAVWTGSIENYDAETVCIYFALNIVLMTAVISGWTIACKINKPQKDVAGKIKANGGPAAFTLLKSAWLLFALALFSYFLYARAYGGFGGLLLYSKLIRSGINAAYNPLSFLQRFGGFSFFASFLFFAVVIDKNYDKKKRKAALAGFIPSFCFSVFVLYSWLGRVAFMVYMLTFLMGLILFFNKSVRKLARKYAFVFILGLIMTVAFDRLLKRSPAGISVIALFVRELSFPSAAFITEYEKTSFRWFKDILAAPLYLLPSRIWRYMLGLDTASMQVTNDFWGVKAETGTAGSIPADLLTFSYMQAHIAGVIIVGLITGAVIYGLQQLQGKIPVESLRAVISSNIILNVIILSVPYGEPYHILLRCFYLIVGLVLIFFIFMKQRAKDGWRK